VISHPDRNNVQQLCAIKIVQDPEKVDSSFEEGEKHKRFETNNIENIV